MKIILLHGPGESSKKTELLKIKGQYQPENIASVDLKQAGFSQFSDALNFIPLFGADKRLVIVENTPESLDLEGFYREDDGLTVVLLTARMGAESKLGKSAVKLKALTRGFEGGKELSAFPFLDTLLEKKRQSFVEMEKLFGQYGASYILTMVYYALRRNLLPLPKPGFVQKKIITQKQKYKSGDFEKLYRFTIETEFAVKSGLINEKSALVRLVQRFLS